MGDTQRVARLACSFPAADGAATIPREAMLALLPSEAAGNVFIWVGSINAVELTAGEWAIEVTAGSATRQTSGWVM